MLENGQRHFHHLQWVGVAPRTSRFHGWQVHVYDWHYGQIWDRLWQDRDTFQIESAIFEEAQWKGYAATANLVAQLLESSEINKESPEGTDA